MSSVLRAKKTIKIRDIESIKEMRDVEALQREIWGPEDLVPLSHLVATKDVGGILVGAFDKDQVVGFVYGFIGCRKGKFMVHSHLLAVKPAYRDQSLGYRLKLAQRERSLKMGFNRVTWTFDPLQSRNANLNFTKLGVIADRYETDFYGHKVSEAIGLNIGTDRLFVTWHLKNSRIIDRIEGRSKSKPCPLDFDKLIRLVRLENGGLPNLTALVEPFPKHALIEIPHSITSVEQESHEKAVAWREATRRAFTSALSSGYIVREFYDRHENDKRFGVYLLSLEKSLKRLF